jgi:hypothetical protein
MTTMKQIHLKCFPERPFQPGFVSMSTYGEDMEWEVLGEHWHNVLKGAVDSIRSNEELRVYWGSIGGSYIAFPIVYNYRHVVELYLKGILLTGETALVLDGQAGIDNETFKEHSFGKIRPQVERVFDTLHVPYDLGLDGFRTKREFRRFLTELDAMEIRYPINTKREPSMKNRFMCFNLFEFAQTMDVLLHSLNGLLSAIGYEVVARCEMAAGSHNY